MFKVDSYTTVERQRKNAAKTTVWRHMVYGDDVTWFMVMTINLFSFDSTYRVTSQALSFVPVVAGMEIYLFIS